MLIYRKLYCSLYASAASPDLSLWGESIAAHPCYFFHNCWLPPHSRASCSAPQQGETSSKVVIFAAEVGQHLSPAGWSGNEPEDEERPLTPVLSAGRGITADGYTVLLSLSTMENQTNYSHLFSVFSVVIDHIHICRQQCPNWMLLSKEKDSQNTCILVLLFIQQGKFKRFSNNSAKQNNLIIPLLSSAMSSIHSSMAYTAYLCRGAGG